MKYLSDFENTKIVESTIENQDEIMKALDFLFSNKIRDKRIFIALDEFKGRAFLCLYREPLDKKYDEVIGLKKDNNGIWVPIGVNDSQDSQ